MDIIKKKISDLSLDPANARKHDKTNLEAIKGSLRRFGQQKPIVINKKNIILAGNGTVAAAIDLGWDEIDVVVTDLVGADGMAYALADNRTAELAEWDKDILGGQLKALLEDNYGIEEFGFDPSEFDLDAGHSGETDPDDVPDIPENENPYNVERGQIWQLGEHRVMCGDSTDKDNVERLMDGVKAEILFTSPPYSDLRDYNGFLNMSPLHLSTFFDVPAKTYFVNLGLQIKDREINCYWNEYLEQAKKRKLKLLAWLVWDKGNASAPAHQQAMFGLSHEWIFVFGEYKKQKLIKENKGGDSWGKHMQREKNGLIKETTKGEKKTHRQLDSVIQHTRAVTGFSGVSHPAQFPIGLPQMFIESSTDIGDIVVEPFCGSGSTLIACEKTKRKCYGMEIDPHYVSVIIKRWEDFTGKSAICLDSQVSES